MPNVAADANPKATDANSEVGVIDYLPESKVAGLIWSSAATESP
jgi:hypothetical protein